MTVVKLLISWMVNDPEIEMLLVDVLSAYLNAPYITPIPNEPLPIARLPPEIQRVVKYRLAVVLK